MNRRNRHARRWGAVIAGAAAATATIAVPAGASTTTVTTLADSGPGSLRQVLAEAPAGASVDFAEGLAGTITLGSELVLARDITVRGPGGAGVTLSGQNRTRVLRVTGGNVRLHRLTIRDGFRRGFFDSAYGAGILVGGGAVLTVTESTVRNNTTSAWGGGIANFGTLVVDRSTIADNVAGPGGGIANLNGALTIRASTVAANVSRVAFDDDDFGDAAGGGLVNVGRGSVLVERSTLSGNRSSSEGGAIASQHTSEPHLVQVVDSTVTANVASVGGGIDSSAPVTLRRSILAGNRAHWRHAECNTWQDGSIVDGGHNLVGPVQGCAIRERQPSTLLGAAPRLGPLTDNGGPTRTHHPLHDSLAIDASTAAAPLDQRGVRRPPAASAPGRRPDIGAVEAERPFGTGTLGGTVRDATGAPLPGASVTATGPERRSATTGADGSFAFDLLDGHYDVQATAYGYGPVEASRQVRAATLTTVDLVLPVPRHVLAGTVRDPSGAPLVGVVVRLDGVPLPEVHTGPDGSFAIDAVPVGEHVVRAAGGCINDATATVTVSGPTTVDLVAEARRDGFGYRCELSVTTPYQGAATPLGLTGSHTQAAVDLPFPFPFYWWTTTRTFVCTSGFVTFSAEDDFCHFRNGPIPDFWYPDAAVYAFWDSRMVASRADTVRTQHLGTGAEERFVIEFHDLTRSPEDENAVAPTITVAVSLYRDGRITLQYAGIDDTLLERGSAAVVGIEGPWSEDGLQYSAFQPVLSSGLTITFHPPSR